MPLIGLAAILALAVVLLSFDAGAQQAAKVPRVGWLTNSTVHTPNVAAFRDGMRALGYRDVSLELRAAAGRTERLPTLAAELVALNVEIIIIDGGPAALAAKQVTATVPIVIGAATSEFLERQALVASLARPGGNITGLTISTGTELHGKRLELLREAVPGLSRVVIAWNPNNQGSPDSLRVVESAAKTLGLEAQTVEAPDIDRLERGLSRAARNPGGALLTIADAFLWGQRSRIVSLAARHRLPAMYPEGEFAADGGLMAYGPRVSDNFRRAATYVDRILKGAKAGDLPVEQPTKFDLVINLKTAKALALTIPPSLLSRADQVIQ
jgi:putative tryptophan/tyrosine transport system substrate-binding protein